MCIKELVEAAITSINHNHVTVFRCALPALDRRVRRNRIGPWIRLGGVAEPHGDLFLAAGDRGKRYPDGSSLPPPGTEVGVQTLIEADACDNGVRTRVEGELVNPPVPRVVRGKDGAARRAGQGPGTRFGARLGRHTGEQRSDQQNRADDPSHPPAIGNSARL